MKRIGSLVSRAACAAGFTAGQSPAGAADGSWYIAPQINALWLDDGRVADDDVGVTLAFGRTLTPNWDAELAVLRFRTRARRRRLARTAGLRRCP